MMHRTRQGGVEPTARNSVCFIHFFLRIGNNDLIKLKTLCQRKVEKNNALRREGIVAGEHLGRRLFQLLGKPANTRLLGTHNGGQPVKLLCLLNKGLHSLQVLGALSIFVVSDHLKELGFFTAALNGACLATLFFAQKRGKQCGNLGRGAVAGQKFTGRNSALAVCCAKDFLNLLKRCGIFPNCLVRVAQKQKVRAREVLSKHHKLRFSVVLNLVNHDKLDVFLASACDKKTQVNTFGAA